MSIDCRFSHLFRTKGEFTLRQMAILEIIARLPAPVSNREIKEELCVPASGVTIAIDKLERERLIVRSPSKGDQRLQTLTATETGKEFLRVAHGLKAFPASNDVPSRS